MPLAIKKIVRVNNLSSCGSIWFMGSIWIQIQILWINWVKQGGWFYTVILQTLLESTKEIRIFTKNTDVFWLLI